MTTRTIVGTIYHSNGTVWAGTTVTFAPQAILINGGWYSTDTITATTAADGTFSAVVSVPDTGTRLYHVALPNQKYYGLNIGAGAPIDITTLIGTASSSVPVNDLQTLFDTHLAAANPHTQYLLSSLYTTHLTDINAHLAIPQYPAVIVAASDAPTAVKNRAAYVCDGVNDEVQIKAAIDSLPVSGGSVLLSGGTFNMYTAGNMDGTEHGTGRHYAIMIDKDTPPITIQGVPGATTLFLANNQEESTYILCIRGTRASRRTKATFLNGINFDHNFANQPAPHAGDYSPSVAGWFTDGITIDHCRFKGDYYFSVQFCYVSPRNVVTHCYFEGLGGVRSESPNLTITNCIFNLDKNPIQHECHGVSIAPDYDEFYDYPTNTIHYTHYGSTISNNIFIGGYNQVFMMACHGVSVTGNIFCDFEELSSYCIRVSPDSALSVAEAGGHHNTISHNTFMNITNGIWLCGSPELYGASYNDVSHNIMLPGYDRAINNGIVEQFGTTGNNNIVDNILITNGPKITKLSNNGTIVRGNIGYKTEGHGAAATIADGGTIDHGLATTPTWANVNASVAGEIATITSLDATHITVAIKKTDGSAGTTQTIYWEAEV